MNIAINDDDAYDDDEDEVKRNIFFELKLQKIVF